MNRRDVLRAASAGLLTGASGFGREDAPAGKSTMGIVEHSYGQRQALDRANGPRGLLDDPAAFLALCAERGAAGVQMSLADKRVPSDSFAKLGQALKGRPLFFELSCALPRNRVQLKAWVDALASYRWQLGVEVVRAVAISGRRYERFTDAAAFRAAVVQAEEALKLVKPVLADPLGMRLAIENHKDWRTNELVALLERLDSPHIGVCLDTGNSVALLEDPMETVEALAPWAITTHLKDMAVEPSEDGFLLSEVPLGNGFLDLPRIVNTIRREQPDIRFNLEMITRDPLKVPCLTRDYWATFDHMSGWPLARTLAMVKRRASKTPLPRVSQLAPERRVQVEDENVRESLRYARERLGLST